LIADLNMMKRTLDFLSEVYGKPHQQGALGPDAYSCFGLTRAAQAAIMGRDLPIVVVNEDSPLEIARAVRRYLPDLAWQAFSGTPQHGDVVTLASPSNPNHIGTWLDLDRGILLHCVRGEGVRVDNLFMMAAAGWSKIVFHRPAVEP
jgi:hypothetical protein